MEVYYLDEWIIIITLHVAGFLHQQYFNTSITVLTNQLWKLLIALFKVPNTGVFTVLVKYCICKWGLAKYNINSFIVHVLAHLGKWVVTDLKNICPKEIISGPQKTKLNIAYLKVIYASQNTDSEVNFVKFLLALFGQLILCDAPKYLPQSHILTFTCLRQLGKFLL